MNRPHIGFYVHYHGMGHKRRTEAILRHLPIAATVLSSRTTCREWSGPTLTDVIELPCDNEGLNEEGLRSATDVPSLHFAPLWSPNVGSRVAAFTHWLSTAKPDVVVVDVSVEISMLTRLASVPQVVMRQHGDRSDPAHSNAYAAAHSLLAPFPKTMEDEITPRWVTEKTVYLHGFGGRSESDRIEPPQMDGNRRRKVVFLFGRGGDTRRIDLLCQAAAALNRYDVVVLGKAYRDDSRQLPANLRIFGWVDNVANHISEADVVVTAAGHNSVMELGRAGRPFIAIAEPRPFDEQLRKVAVLRREKLAIGLDHWPDPERWPSLIRKAHELDQSRWNSIFSIDGSKQAAEHLTEVANLSHEQRKQVASISL